MQAKIRLSYRSVKDAEAVAQAVAPDNIKVPIGLFVKTTRQGKEVYTQINCETSLETFMATIDDLLSAVSVAERTVSAVRRD